MQDFHIFVLMYLLMIVSVNLFWRQIILTQEISLSSKLKYLKDFESKRDNDLYIKSEFYSSSDFQIQFQNYLNAKEFFLTSSYFVILILQIWAWLNLGENHIFFYSYGLLLAPCLFVQAFLADYSSKNFGFLQRSFSYLTLPINLIYFNLSQYFKNKYFEKDIVAFWYEPKILLKYISISDLFESVVSYGIFLIFIVIFPTWLFIRVIFDFFQKDEK